MLKVYRGLWVLVMVVQVLGKYMNYSHYVPDDYWTWVPYSVIIGGIF